MVPNLLMSTPPMVMYSGKMKLYRNSNYLTLKILKDS